MSKTNKYNGISHTQKVIMVSVYDNMQKTSTNHNFQANHKPYQFTLISKKK